MQIEDNDTMWCLVQAFSAAAKVAEIASVCRVSLLSLEARAALPGSVTLEEDLEAYGWNGRSVVYWSTFDQYNGKVEKVRKMQQYAEDVIGSSPPVFSEWYGSVRLQRCEAFVLDGVACCCIIVEAPKP